MSTEVFHAFAEGFPEPLLFVSPEGALCAYNQAFADLFEGNVETDVMTALCTTPCDEVRDYLHLCARSRQFVIGSLVLRTHRGDVPYKAEGALIQPEAPGGEKRIVLRLSARPASSAQFVLLNQKVEELNREIRHRVQVENELRHLNATLEDRVEARTREVRQLASALTLAEQAERRRIGQVLHDHLQQMLYAAMMKTGLLRQHATRQAQEEQVMLVDQLHEVLTRAVNLCRTLNLEMDPPLLQGEGLEAALRWLADHVRGAYDLHVHLHVPLDVAIQSDDVRVLVYQCVRELLFNVHKHAGVSEAVVEVGPEGDTLVVQVSDQGRGFDPERLRRPGQGTYGLASILERVRLVGGRVTFQSAPGTGTRVTMKFPGTLSMPPS